MVANNLTGSALPTQAKAAEPGHVLSRADILAAAREVAHAYASSGHDQPPATRQAALAEQAHFLSELFRFLKPTLAAILKSRDIPFVETRDVSTSGSRIALLWDGSLVRFDLANSVDTVAPSELLEARRDLKAVLVDLDAGLVKEGEPDGLSMAPLVREIIQIIDKTP